jgi:hypothetical protein
LTGDALHRRASLSDRLLLNSNHAHRYRSPLSLRHFQTRLHRQCFSFEWVGQRRELTIDVFEEQPLLDEFGHLRFIAQALLLVIMLAKVNHGSRLVQRKGIIGIFDRIWPLRTVMRRRMHFLLAHHLENRTIMFGEGRWVRLLRIMHVAKLP